MRTEPLTAPLDVTFSRFRGIGKRVRGIERDVPWVDLEERLRTLLESEATDKRDLPGLVFAPVTGSREDANTGKHTALVIDVDALPGGKLKPFLRACADLRCYVYETPSSREPGKGPRVRVIAALQRPLSRSKTVAARYALAHRLGLDPSASGVAGAKGHSQVMFIGRLAETERRRFWSFEGETWRVPKVLPSAESHRAARQRPAARRSPSSTGWDPSSPPDLSALAPHLAPAGRDDDRHALVRALGGWLARRGYDPLAIADAVREQVPSDRPDERAEQALAAAQRALHEGDAPGWDYLSHRFGSETLEALRAAVADPREPEGFAGVWQGDRSVSDLEAWRSTFARFTPAGAVLAEEAPGLDGLDLDEDGRPYGTIANVTLCVAHFVGHALARDDATGRTLLTAEAKWSGARIEPDVLPVGPWRDVYTATFQAHLNRLGMRGARKSDVQDAVATVASWRPINVHGEWLRTLAAGWDGVARVNGALARYWKADETAATTAVSRIMLLSIAARGLSPGEQVDTVPVLIGEQGCGKSQSLRALVLGAARRSQDAFDALPYGADRRWCASRLDMHHKDGMAVVRGFLVWELAELASTAKTDADVQKDFFSRTSDTFRPSFAREEETYRRTVCFIGTVNPDAFGQVIINRDLTGGRRWLPVWVGDVDLLAIERDHEQLLGEAAARVLTGERWHPSDAEKVAVKPLVDAVTELNADAEDPWLDAVRRWLRKVGRGDTFRIKAIFDPGNGAIPIDVEKVQSREIWRVGKILRSLGCTQAPGAMAGMGVWRTPSAR